MLKISVLNMTFLSQCMTLVGPVAINMLQVLIGLQFSPY